jgi:hypothetical protein
MRHKKITKMRLNIPLTFAKKNIITILFPRAALLHKILLFVVLYTVHCTFIFDKLASMSSRVEKIYVKTSFDIPLIFCYFFYILTRILNIYEKKV